ncbi:MAG: heavy metal translocating P-type ATPase, partial [Chloroflexi bacterium]|nr:heavy metal translocating P-type ATPase [Chloroflexota bacterium]
MAKQPQEHHQESSHQHKAVHHSSHEMLFRNRFWGSVLLSLPVLVYSATIQDWLGYQAPTVSGSDWITPVFSVVLFAYGGVPFLQMAMPELRQ